jgi:MscS family membrane protein
VLGLHADTAPDHLRFVLEEIRRVLSGHAKIETDTVRVRLTDLTPGALNVELFCYVLTRDFNEFAEVREDLLLQIMSFVEESGTTLASASQTLYLNRDAESTKEKIDAAAKKTTGARDEQQQPSPDIHGKNT